MATSLLKLHLDALWKGIRTLHAIGVNIKHWNAMLGADPQILGQLKQEFENLLNHPTIYGTTTVLRHVGMEHLMGQLETVNAPVTISPQRLEIAFYCGPWSVAQLCHAIPHNFTVQNCVLGNAFTHVPPAGNYLLFRQAAAAEGRPRRTEDLRHLGFVNIEPTPAAIALTALITHHKMTGKDFLAGNPGICKETTERGEKVFIQMRRGTYRVSNVYDAYDSQGRTLCLMKLWSAQKS